jgi:hypothetical protein
MFNIPIVCVPEIPKGIALLAYPTKNSIEFHNGKITVTKEFQEVARIINIGENTEMLPTPSTASIEQIRLKQDELEKAKEQRCTCSGVSMEFNKTCQCDRGKIVKQLETELTELLKSL